jgi:hypothetical protein
MYPCRYRPGTSTSTHIIVYNTRNFDYFRLKKWVKRNAKSKVFLKILTNSRVMDKKKERI